jgi:hypothetical protein
MEELTQAENGRTNTGGKRKNLHGRKMEELTPTKSGRTNTNEKWKN